MKVTREMICGHTPCSEGLEWFDTHYPDGEGDYQEILDKTVATGDGRYGGWLTCKLGSSGETVKLSNIEGYRLFAGSVEVTGNVACESIVCAGSLEVGGSLKVGDSLEVGGSLKVGNSLKVGSALKVGESLDVGGSLDVAGALRVGWHLEVGESLDVAGSLKVGWHLDVAGSLKVGRHLAVGESMVVGGSITTNLEYSLFVGLALKTSDWPTLGYLKAGEKPANMLSGHFIKTGS